MNKETDDKEPFEDILNGTPEMLRPLISRVADELHLKGCKYGVQEEKRVATPAFTKYIVRARQESADADDVGIITLQLLPGGQTLFRVPPRHSWDFYREALGISFGESPQTYYIYISPGDFNLRLGNEVFTEFLMTLFTEFRRLGLKETLRKRIWRWFCEIRETVKVFRFW